jgi:hypothetical protein
LDWSSGGILGFTILLILVAYLSFIIGKHLMKKALKLSSTLISTYMCNLVFHTFLIIVWVYYCFNVPLAWGIESLPIGGVILGLGSMCLSSITITIAFLFLRRNWTS